MLAGVSAWLFGVCADIDGYNVSNILILAFVGSAVSELVINYAYNLPFRQIINSYNIGIEIMQGVSGSIGVILTVPAVAAITAFLCNRKFQ